MSTFNFTATDLFVSFILLPQIVFHIYVYQAHPFQIPSFFYVIFIS